MIRNFLDAETERIWTGEHSRKLPPEIQSRALNRLRLIDAAMDLNDLCVPPGNRLHALEGDRVGQHSIFINMQWRICFVWSDGGADDVEIVDYH